MNTLFKKFSSLAVASATFLSLMGGVSALGSGENYQVQIDDKMVAFSDATPIVQSGRTMVPFRAVLEQMGATVGYDEAQNKITAKLKDKEISFQEGSDLLDIKQGEATSQIKMDVRPYMNGQNDRVYVPVRFLAESFGYVVGFDAAKDTVVILDISKLAQELDANLTILNKTLQTNANMEDTYAIVGDGTMKMTLTQGTSIMSTDMTQKISGLQAGLIANMKQVMEMKMKMEDPTLTAADKAAMDAALNNITIEQEIIMDMQNGKMYTKQKGMPESTLPDGTKITEETWLKSDLSKMMDDVSLSSLVSSTTNSATTIGKQIQGFAPMLASSLTTTSYSDAKKAVDFLIATVGDKRFTSTTAGSTTTHKLTIDKTLYLSMIGKIPTEMFALINDAVSDATAQPFDLMKDLKTLEGTISLVETNGKLEKYNTTGMMDFTNGIAFKVMISSDAALNTKVDLSCKVPNMLDFLMNVNATMSKTDATPVTAPPAGAQIVDITNLAMAS